MRMHSRSRPREGLHSQKEGDRLSRVSGRRQLHSWIVLVAYLLGGMLQLFHGLEGSHRTATPPPPGPTIVSSCPLDCNLPGHDHRPAHDHANCEICRVAATSVVVRLVEYAAPAIVATAETRAPAVWIVPGVSRPSELLARAPPVA